MNNETPILIIQGIVMIAFLMIGAHVTTRTRSVLKGGILTYGLLVLWSVCFCYALPRAVASITQDSSLLYGLFPDIKGVVAMPLLGWIHGFAFAGIVRGIQVLVLKIKERQDRKLV